MLFSNGETYKRCARRVWLSFTESEHNPGPKPETVLAVVVAVREFCQQVFGLTKTNRHVSGHPQINAASCCRSKCGYRPEGKSVLRPHTSEKNLSERCDFPAPYLNSRTE